MQNFIPKHNGNSSSCEQQESEVAYGTVRNDHEMENIEVDEPIIQKVRSTGASYVKQEMADDASDPLYTEDYLDASPKRKSPTKKQSTIQNGEFIVVATPSAISKMKQNR